MCLTPEDLSLAMHARPINGLTTFTPMSDVSTAAQAVKPVEIFKFDQPQLEVLQGFLATYDLPDIIFGSVMLLLILFFHGLSMAAIGEHYEWQSTRLLAARRFWLVEIVFYFSMIALMITHVVEIGIWSCALYAAGLVDNLRRAIVFTGNTYTTVGYGEDILPLGWKLLTTIIALSGMFAFAWTTTVLLNMMKMYQEARVARRTTQEKIR